jgi:hypothetical protein
VHVAQQMLPVLPVHHDVHSKEKRDCPTPGLAPANRLLNQPLR